jgi:Site-specific recombinase XerD
MNSDHNSLAHHLNQWLSLVKGSKSDNTFRTSVNAGKSFMRAAGRIDISKLTEAHYSQFLKSLKGYNARTERLYSTIIFGFYKYLSAKEILLINLPKLEYIRQNEQRKPGKRLRKFDRPSIEQLKKYVIGYRIPIKKLPPIECLILARSRALIILSLDSGLRVSEIVKLMRSDLDFSDLSGSVIGKGNKERQFLFTEDSVSALHFYFNLRARLEPGRYKDIFPDQSPVFVSHSKRGHNKLVPMDTDTARLDLRRMISTALIKMKYPVTNHMLRHFAGDDLYKRTGDIELTRVMLGHESTQTTADNYIHDQDELLRKAYRKHYGRSKISE